MKLDFSFIHELHFVSQRRKKCLTKNSAEHENYNIIQSVFFNIGKGLMEKFTGLKFVLEEKDWIFIQDERYMNSFVFSFNIIILK